MNRPILEMKGIGKRFPGVIALDRVDFAIGQGEVVALAGENGAGKSTLMKILGGVYQPDDGQVFVDGKEVAIRSVTDASVHGIGFVHQELNVLDNLTAAENVYLGREPRKFGFLVDRRKLNADAQVHLKRLGLNISGKTRLSELSIAQQQMVELAKALSLNARILIMDEPTSSLTLTETERLLAVIKDLRGQGVSIHVADLADVHVRALDHLQDGGGSTHLNLGNGIGFSVFEVIEAARRVTGKPIEALIAPRCPGDPSHLIADATKAYKVLGWKPEFTDMEGIIKTAWDWKLANPNGYS